MTSFEAQASDLPPGFRRVKDGYEAQLSRVDEYGAVVESVIGKGRTIDEAANDAIKKARAAVKREAQA